MVSCPNCQKPISAALLALTGLGLPASCRHCDARVTLPRHWQHALGFAAVVFFAFGAAESFKQRSYLGFLPFLAALVVCCLVVARTVRPIVHRSRQSASAWLGLVVFVFAAVVAIHGLPG